MTACIQQLWQILAQKDAKKQKQKQHPNCHEEPGAAGKVKWKCWLLSHV